jgi:hypothetical protein
VKISAPAPAKNPGSGCGSRSKRHPNMRIHADPDLKHCLIKNSFVLYKNLINYEGICRQGCASIILKRTLHSFNSFPFFRTECSVLSFLFCSFEKNRMFFPFFQFCWKNWDVLSVIFFLFCSFDFDTITKNTRNAKQNWERGSAGTLTLVREEIYLKRHAGTRHATAKCRSAGTRF